ncbi:hypothetical protein BURPS1106B_A2710 [Burkholderia pseudomallei 1106b]|uniref:Uncharacterized protein n=1 Tax=Burkholderia pseudomallei (strain 1106a) TaxID=357348 RepID=A3NZF9_BURP0|nr:hypothetical protein BURPS668_3456 [Burkholderia pseudomallei 668]ABN89215.1 hypothetical protein BURPS1106A_3494 [Burkholderia pseudomallei 1106a]AFR17386.1 hypothetical protein BPC006_I3541 [Burkholderia pseudomallei BPC006]EBA48532.1 hypothetical protein BURPS305_4280 [Burkholderia pseudomallei 305]EES25902.1 hypothetical protein BURPS1106B_A2710 [Burkholderia pseudomallei 1106b]
MENSETFERNHAYFILSFATFHLNKISDKSDFKAALCQTDRP